MRSDKASRETAQGNFFELLKLNFPAGEITMQKREITDVEKKIHDVQNYMVRLDTLIHKETGAEDTLANDNILRENEFMRSLKVISI